MTTTQQPNQKHHGRNIKRLRELFNIKQEVLADSLGEQWSQKKISLLEDKEVIEDNILHEVARALRITPEVIKNFDEQAAINIVSNTFQDFKDHAIANANHCTFNPIDKIVELYERLVQAEKEKAELLEKILSERKS